MMAKVITHPDIRNLSHFPTGQGLFIQMMCQGSHLSPRKIRRKFQITIDIHQCSRALGRTETSGTWTSSSNWRVSRRFWMFVVFSGHGTSISGRCSS